MRVSQKPAATRPERGLWFAGLALVLGACSSTPLSEPSDENGTPAPSSPAPGDAGDQPATPGANAALYQKRDYPAGPYGLGVGAILEDFAFLGWRDPVAAGYDPSKLETVRLSDFYNPDGRSTTKLLWINASAVWCSVCQFEMEDIKTNGVRAEFEAKGVQLIGTLFEDIDAGPSKPADLVLWGRTAKHSIDFPLLLDPGFKLGAFFVSDATPLNMLVDAATMRVIDTTMGYSVDYWQAVDKLLARY